MLGDFRGWVVVNTAIFKDILDFLVEITIANPGLRGDYNEMALTQILPSGWEIHNTRLDETGDFYSLAGNV